MQRGACADERERSVQFNEQIGCQPYGHQWEQVGKFPKADSCHGQTRNDGGREKCLPCRQMILKSVLFGHDQSLQVESDVRPEIFLLKVDFSGIFE